MNVSNENYRGFTFEENNNLYDEFNFEKNVKDAPLYVFDFNKNSDANLNLNDNFMSVSPRQLFGGNFDCSPYIYNDKMMVFDSMDAVEEFWALPNKPNQKRFLLIICPKTLPIRYYFFSGLKLLEFFVVNIYYFFNQYLLYKNFINIYYNI